MNNKCDWVQEGDYDSTEYATECNQRFNIEEGTPESNDFKYCCFCGKQLNQIPFNGDEA